MPRRKLLWKTITKSGTASKKEDGKNIIDVRDFIQTNYIPYEGDDSFLVGATKKQRMFGISVVNY